MTPPSDALEALKPCPFCGGGAYVNYSDRGELFGVRCNQWRNQSGGSMSCMGAGAYADTEADAIKAWNTRANTIAPIARVTDERLREAVARIDDEFGSATVFNRELCENDWAIIANAISELQAHRDADGVK